jgi:hypothetical protein
MTAMDGTDESAARCKYHQGFAPKTLFTDKLRSYGAAKAQLGLSARHEQGLRKNDRAREFASAGSATRAEDAAFQIARISATVPICSRRRPNTFNVQRHLVSRNTLRVLRGEALQNWRAATAA